MVFYKWFDTYTKHDTRIKNLYILKISIPSFQTFNGIFTFASIKIPE